MVLHRERASSLGRDLLLREIKLAARLNHQHILPLFDSVEADGFLFYVRLPFRVRKHIRDFRPDAIFASDPVLGAASLLGRELAGLGARVIVEVHGDWRTFARAYGSPSRRVIAPVVDELAARAVKHADATRAVST